MQKNRAMWVALIVLAFASVLMIFVVLPAINEGDTVSEIAGNVGEAAKQASETVGDTVNDAVDEVAGEASSTSTNNEAAAEVAVAPEVAEAPTQASGTPVFDILRVEKSGSTVIAGKAAPGGKLEVLDGDAVIASTNVGAGGDFVAILEQPLKAGDHQITLKVTGKDGTALTSEEVATVSVPANASGDLLAMVTKPGEASRLITAPDAAPTTTPAPEIAAVQTTAADAPVDNPPAVDGVAVPDLPAKSADLATSAPVVDTEVAATQPAPVAQTPVTAQPTIAADAKAAPEVQVSAVEIEGDKIFVAGAARPGATVRVYANETFIGEAKADQTGRFVVDNTLSLPVGSHVIRADVLSADGARVAFRASVPFDRPAGEQFAVVADPTADIGSTAAMVPIDTAKFDKARGDAAKALALLNGLFVDNKTPTAEELAAARSASEIALKALAEMKPEGQPDAGAVAEGAGKAFAMLKALGNDGAAVKDGLADIAAVVAPLLPSAPSAAIVAEVTPAASPVAVEPETAVAQAQVETPMAETQPVQTPAEPATAEVTPAPAEPAAAVQTPDAATSAETAASSSEPTLVAQAPLKPSRSSVIIRRGDTLWQISRRVYGQGVRYTTIYVANQAQIDDPDRIMPGQIFGVPETPLPNAEEIHRKHLKTHAN